MCSCRMFHTIAICFRFPMRAIFRWQWETLYGTLNVYSIVCLIFVPIYCNLDISFFAISDKVPEDKPILPCAHHCCDTPKIYAFLCVCLHQFTHICVTYNHSKSICARRPTVACIFSYFYTPDLRKTEKIHILHIGFIAVPITMSQTKKRG